ncbi:MAG: hypothetical protein WBL56_19300, partial [Candidatus Acidiferrum sp.]
FLTVSVAICLSLDQNFHFKLPSPAAFPKRWPFESLISDRRKDKRIRNLCLYKRAHRGTYIGD